MTDDRKLIGPPYAHLDGPCGDGCYETDRDPQGCTRCGIPHSSSIPCAGMTVFETFSGPVQHSHTDLFNILNTRLERIEQRQEEIRETMIRTEEVVQKFIAALTPVLDDIVPMISNMVENPLIKMAFRGKKS